MGDAVSQIVDAYCFVFLRLFFWGKFTVDLVEEKLEVPQYNRLENRSLRRISKA